MGKALVEFLVGAAIIAAPQHQFALAAGSLVLKSGLALKQKSKADHASRLEASHGKKQREIKLEWKNVSVALHDKKSGNTKQIFKDVSGSANPGRYKFLRETKRHYPKLQKDTNLESQ